MEGGHVSDHWKEKKVGVSLWKADMFQTTGPQEREKGRRVPVEGGHVSDHWKEKKVGVSLWKADMFQTTGERKR